MRICSSIKVTHALRHIISDGLSSITESHPELNLPPGFLSKSTRNHPHLKIRDSPAPEATLELLREHAAHSVTYVLLGPLTNLTWMLRTDGACVRERIGRVMVIGGALDVPGNVTPSAEFNFLADPYAVDEVLISPTARLPPAQVLLLPLYVTSAHLLPFHGYAMQVDPAFAADKPSVPTAQGKFHFSF
ncbi:Inosine/uridine-preferring nucleoside hydrolase domain-containing protein [Russula earlei]|uniref:Inosine/uridine-preferring nucleoside hydrolase domain-containing protein n=1 Tax=Russula earlei TaxID=71964 RepID=A0ACC0U568_9AGAM|nr:Inosine/uridine-preferring nucleoside hydrolase domain-containing protein [Russula earlei]